MAQLIINQDATLRNYLEAFRSIFSVPQWKYFETILMRAIALRREQNAVGDIATGGGCGDDEWP